MENMVPTVSFNTFADRYEIRDSTGSVERATPGGTIAELMDRGLTQSDATAQVLAATRLAWGEV